MTMKVSKEIVLNSLKNTNKDRIIIEDQGKTYMEIDPTHSEMSLKQLECNESSNIKILGTRINLSDLPKSAVHNVTNTNTEVKFTDENVKIEFPNLIAFKKIFYIHKDLKLILKAIENNINSNKSILINRKGLFDQADSLYSIQWEFNFNDAILKLTVLP